MRKKKKEKKFRKLHRRKIKKPFYKKKFFIYLILVILLLSIFLYFIAFFHFFSIKKIEIKGNDKIKSERLIQFIDEKTTKSLLFWESKSLFFFIPKKIAPEIIKEFPSLYGFHLKRIYPDTVELKVKERIPIGVWCLKDCFFFDKSGKIYEKTDIKFGIIVETEDNHFNNKELKFSDKEIKSMILIWKNLNPDIGIKKIKISGSKLDISTKKGWNIYLTLEKDIEFQLTKLYLVLKERIPPEKLKNIDYIDLRFEKRVYFK